MHVINPLWHRTTAIDIPMPSLPDVFNGQVPTGGVIPFTLTDVSRTTSAFGAHPVTARTLPSPLIPGSVSAQHASARAVAVLGRIQSELPGRIGAIIQSPAHPALVGLVRALEAMPKQAFGAARGFIPHVPIVRQPGPTL